MLLPALTACATCTREGHGGLGVGGRRLSLLRPAPPHPQPSEPFLYPEEEGRLPGSPVRSRVRLWEASGLPSRGLACRGELAFSGSLLRRRHTGRHGHGTGGRVNTSEWKQGRALHARGRQEFRAQDWTGRPSRCLETCFRAGVGRWMLGRGGRVVAIGGVGGPDRVLLSRGPRGLQGVSLAIILPRGSWDIGRSLSRRRSQLSIAKAGLPPNPRYVLNVSGFGGLQIWRESPGRWWQNWGALGLGVVLSCLEAHGEVSRVEAEQGWGGGWKALFSPAPPPCSRPSRAPAAGRGHYRRCCFT